MYTCGICGGVVEGAPAGLIRERGPCHCIRCETCGREYGNTLETSEWNDMELHEHNRNYHVAWWPRRF